MSSKSLFPAYATTSASEDQNASRKEPTDEWLQNSSFAPDLACRTSVEEQENSSGKKTHLDLKDEFIIKKHATVSKGISEESNEPHAYKGSVTAEKSVPSEAEEGYSIQSHLKRLVFIEDTGLSFERAYRIDVNCDPENFTFGCLDRKHIAKYNTKNQIPLGLQPQEVGLWLRETKSKKAKKDPRYFTPVSETKREKYYATCVIQNDPLPSLPDYVPVSSVSNRRGLEDTLAIRTFDGISVDWKAQIPEPGKLSSSSEILPVPSPAEQEITERTASYNRQLKEDPQNEQLWLDFISFQDEVFKVLSCYKNVSSLEHSCFEKKIAILDRALEQNPNFLKLRTAKLKLCKGFWENDKLQSSWEQLLFLFPNDIDIWNHYLTFVLSNFTYFTVPHIIKVYNKCLKTLKGIHEGHFQSHAAAPNILENMLDIFSQLCSILLESGHNEQALATFQALIEFNLFTPIGYSSLTCEELEILFESFWDSGVPRFGEDNAAGWSAAVSRKQVYANLLVNFHDLNSLEDDILNQKFPQWKTWLEFENLRKSFCWLPWRPNPDLNQTMEDCEDQHRTVPYEDIAKMLFMLTSENIKFALFCKFLNFLGIELHKPSCHFFSEKGKNAQLHFVSFDSLTEALNSLLPESSNMLKLPKLNEFRDQAKFVSNVFLQAKAAFSSNYANLLSLMHLRYIIQHTLRNMSQGTQNQSFKYLKKISKSVLKETCSRNCLFLWTEYIFIEWISGNKIVAEDTFENLLLAGTNLGVDDDQYKAVTNFVASNIETLSEMKSAQFCNKPASKITTNKKFAWILVHACSKEKYLKWGDDESVRPTMVLRAVTVLRAAIDSEFSLLGNSHTASCKCQNPYSYPVTDFIKCLMYLQYFTQGISAATHVFREMLEYLSVKLEKISSTIRKQVEQQLYISHGWILNFHTWNTESSLKSFRSFLFEAVEKFPSNACLLHLLANLKSASSVIGQIRRFFYKVVNSNVELSPVTWLFAIASELSICYSIQEPMEPYGSRNEPATGVCTPTFLCGMTWKIRSLFEKALQSPNSQHCVALWRTYCKFEMALGDVSRAKKVFHQSLQHCVWSKSLYMDAILYFPDEFLNILSVLSEKHLRIHTPVEEVSLLMDHFANAAE